jgi:hypothetical protein
MYSTLSLLPLTPYRGQQYIPSVSSPLSFSSFSPSPASHDGGISPTRLYCMSMSPPTPAGDRIEDRKKKKRFSDRVARVNPLIHNGDNRREARRNLFLQKVKDGSERRRWEARGGDDEVS